MCLTGMRWRDTRAHRHTNICLCIEIAVVYASVLLHLRDCLFTIVPCFRSSNSERLAYAEEIMDDILDSADNPMDVSCCKTRIFCYHNVDFIGLCMCIRDEIVPLFSGFPRFWGHFRHFCDFLRSVIKDWGGLGGVLL